MPSVEAKCITCGKLRTIRAGEVKPGEMPICGDCGSVMIAILARRG